MGLPRLSLNALKLKSSAAHFTKGEVLLCAFKSRSSLACWISTSYGNTLIPKSSRSKQKAEHYELVGAYAKEMGAVDSHNRARNSLNQPHRVDKWHTVVFFHLLNCTISNAWVLFKIRRNENITIHQFMERLIPQLLPNLAAHKHDDTSKRQQQEPTKPCPQPGIQKSKCTHCSGSRVTYWCPICGTHLHEKCFEAHRAAKHPENTEFTGVSKPGNPPASKSSVGASKS